MFEPDVSPVSSMLFWLPLQVPKEMINPFLILPALVCAIGPKRPLIALLIGSVAYAAVFGFFHGGMRPTGGDNFEFDLYPARIIAFWAVGGLGLLIRRMRNQ